MITVTYEYYKEEYKGSLSEQQFNKLLKKAFIHIDNCTADRASKVTDNDNELLVDRLRMCVCAMIDKISANTDENGVEREYVKASESVGPWSVSFATGNSSGSLAEQYKGVCELYLGNTELMKMLVWV